MNKADFDVYMAASAPEHFARNRAAQAHYDTFTAHLRGLNAQIVALGDVHPDNPEMAALGTMFDALTAERDRVQEEHLQWIARHQSHDWDGD